jgi:hypothetical protein
MQIDSEVTQLTTRQERPLSEGKKGTKAKHKGNLNTFALLNDQMSTDPPSMLRVSVV